MCSSDLTPGTIGAIRMAICIILAWVTYWMRLREMTILPESQRISMGIMDLFYKLGWGYVVHNVALVQTLKWLCIGLCFVGAAGYKTRIVLPLIAILYLPLAGITRSFFWFNHCGVIPFYCLVVLCFTRAGDGWSIDRLIRKWRGQEVPNADLATSYYGWVRLAIWLCVCIPYCAAGLSKIRYGTAMWWDANNMQYILFADGLRPGGETLAMKMLWLPGWFFALMGIGTLITEIGFITVPFLRAARLLLPASMFGMHLGIWLIMGINFYDLLLIQAIFYDWSPLRRWVAARLAAKRGTITVLFDGNCTLCQRTIRTLRPMDIFSRLNIVDFRAADLSVLSASHRVTLDAQRLEREMIVIKNRQTFGGANGARVIAGALPALWLVWPMLAIPGLSHVASAIYRRIAKNRMSLVKCDPEGTACALPAASAKTPTTAIATESTDRLVLIGGWPVTLRGFRFPAVVASMFWVMGIVWVTSTEWYPITGMQMFSNYADTTVVSYYRAYVTYEDGSTEIARFEKMGGGIARYKNTLEAPFLPLVPQAVRDKGRRECVDLMVRSGNAWNANSPPPGKRIVRIETHHKNWDFIKQRDDTVNWGTTIDKVSVDIVPTPSARVAAGA